MTSKEIKTILDIPTSTMSDWERNTKRAKLAHLLKNISVESVEKLLLKEDTSPKYSVKTQKIRLNKKLFVKDILWAQEDGSEVSIKNLICALFNIPNQEDTAKIIQLFGEKRVLGILYRNKLVMNTADYQESFEQILYITSPDTYNMQYPLPDMDTILHNPKQRYIEQLLLLYSQEELLSLAKSKDVSLTTLLQIKKFFN